MSVTTVKVTPDMLAQEQERLDNLDAADGVQEDSLDAGAATGGADDDGAAGGADEGNRRPPAIPRSPSDDRRAEIASRFKRTEDRPFDGDMTNPENLYGDVARVDAAEPEPDASIVGDVLEPEPAPAAAAPKTRTLKVRGKDVTMTEDDILAAAQKTLAADSYFEDSRKILEEAEDIRRQAKAERAGRDPQHPEGRSSTEDDGAELDADGNPQHPADELEALIESIQYKDPKEAAPQLRKAIVAEAAKAANEGHLNRLFNNDLSKSQKALADFTAAHPELDGDEIAAQIIERNMYTLYREELLSLGLDEAKIPTTSRELANWHRMQRIHGFAVSDTTKLLTEATERMNKWRGAPSKPATPQPGPKPAPRVEVNVNRTERRAAIPNQPSRASLPQRPAAPAPAKQPGSDVIAEMRRSRGQISV